METSKHSRTKVKRNFLVRWIVVLAIVFFVNFYQLPYYFTLPGEPKKLDEVIEVAGGHPYEGSFMLTTVRMGQANIVNYVWALLSDQRELVHETEVRPEGESDEEYHHRQMMVMSSSQETAVLVAYDYMGKEVYFENNGILVTSIIKGMSAENALELGDLIVAVEGEETLDVETFLDRLSQFEAGDDLELTIIRDDEEEKTVEVSVSPFPEEIDPEGENAGIGIANPMTDRDLIQDPDVSIDTDKIGGPSAGLMFTLEIMNQLSDEDITKGYDIAGTGSINEEGTVGRIGGVHQKVLASEQSGADAFFAPAEFGAQYSNYEVAKKTAEEIDSDMDIVPVNTFEDALEYLDALP
ncbi:SepM family pheromone-processing serine protease [Texcoconibacillus texcoconensis]|uniref:endopeptidase La n=1 Tax=Texcoconibacillus texcoconensis TaxID=1095777 RepID=A0A840QLF2_9BACI|nr:SepM family pheromone-processing serine protease [Texcoconibacillus texcoconensis]MBB5172193.1 PDZ domain-containing protein [Texcoconibacillus texcoconensis]